MYHNILVLIHIVDIDFTGCLRGFLQPEPDLLVDHRDHSVHNQYLQMSGRGEAIAVTAGIKPRKTAAVHWRQSAGGLLSLVNT